MNPNSFFNPNILFDEKKKKKFPVELTTGTHVHVQLQLSCNENILSPILGTNRKKKRRELKKNSK